MSLVFQTNGLLTTIQDLGRNGFRSLGVNPNGSMDRAAMRLINVLLGNDENEAVLEIHFPAPKILFEKNALIAIGGANFGAKIDERFVENWQTIWIEKGQTLSFTEKRWGNRLYLSVRGGFKLEDWLGSKSTNLIAKIGGFAGRALQKNDRLDFKVQSPESKAQSDLKVCQYSLPYFKTNKIRVIEGAEFNLLTPLSAENFFRQSFKISPDSNRMGFRLISEPCYLLHEKELVSSAVTFGTIQLLPNGQLIILMADHQTTGGYPRIGNVAAVDLPKLSQFGADDSFQFKLISLEEAEKLALDFERDLQLLRTAIKFR